LLKTLARITFSSVSELGLLSYLTMEICTFKYLNSSTVGRISEEDTICKQYHKRQYQGAGSQ